MFVIPFIGLKDGNHHFEYKIDKKFFEVYPYEDILDAKVLVDLDFVKKSTLLELGFNVEGQVKVLCDLTNEPYQQPIKGDLDLIVKFGDTFNDENEEVLIIPRESHEVDIAQYIYEIIVLALPSKRVHPGVKDGSLKSDILDKLKELQPKLNIKNKSSDPRWDKLKGLLTDKNK